MVTIREHFSNIEINEPFAIATLLDPRYKTRGFSKRENVNIAKDLLFAELVNKIDLSVSYSLESQQVIIVLNRIRGQREVVGSLFWTVLLKMMMTT